MSTGWRFTLVAIDAVAILVAAAWLAWHIRQRARWSRRWSQAGAVRKAFGVAAMIAASLMALAWIALVLVACGLSVDPGFLGANQSGQGPLLALLLAIGLPVIVAAGMLTSEVLLLPMRLYRETAPP